MAEEENMAKTPSSHEILELLNEIEENIDVLNMKKSAIRRKLSTKILKLFLASEDLTLIEAILKTLSQLKGIDNILIKFLMKKLKLSFQNTEIFYLILSKLESFESFSKNNLHQLFSILIEAPKGSPEAQLLNLLDKISFFIDHKNLFDNMFKRLVKLYSMDVSYESVSNKVIAIITKNLQNSASINDYVILRSYVLSKLMQKDKHIEADLKLLSVFPFQRDVLGLIPTLLPKLTSEYEIITVSSYMLHLNTLNPETLKILEDTSFVTKISEQVPNNIEITCKVLCLIALSISSEERLIKQLLTKKVVKKVLDCATTNLTDIELQSIFHLIWCFFKHIPIYITENQIKLIFQLVTKNLKTVGDIGYQIVEILSHFSQFLPENFLKDPFEACAKSVRDNPTTIKLTFLYQCLEIDEKLVNLLNSDDLVFILQNYDNVEHKFLVWVLLKKCTTVDDTDLIMLINRDLKVSNRLEDMAAVLEFIIESSDSLKKELSSKIDKIYNFGLELIRKFPNEDELETVLIKAISSLIYDAYSLKQALSLILIILSINASKNVQLIGWRSILEIAKKLKTFTLSKPLSSSLYYRIYNVSKVKYDEIWLQTILLDIFYELGFHNFEDLQVLNLILKYGEDTDSVEKELKILKMFETNKNKIDFNKHNIGLRQNRAVYKNSSQLKKRIEALLANDAKEAQAQTLATQVEGHPSNGWRNYIPNFNFIENIKSLVF